MGNQHKTPLSYEHWHEKNQRGFFLTYSLSSLSSSMMEFDVFVSEFSRFFAILAITSRNSATRFFSWATFSWTSFTALGTSFSAAGITIENSMFTCLAGHYHRKTHIQHLFDKGNSHQTGGTLQYVNGLFRCFECIFCLIWHKTGRLFRFSFWQRLGRFN